ncbi:MAG: DUF6529 family protein [Candidatus Aminicenantes bacterium]|nr:DUF6529 family protein [Candidatus Aminicenantes bacterium]
MPLFLIKSIMAVVFILTAVVAFLAMMMIMGRPGHKSDPKKLKIIHKTAGFLYFGLLLVISYICLRHWILAGDGISIRASFHAFLAWGLLFVFLLKITIVRFFKGFLKIVPTLGLIVLILSLTVTATSAGYYILRSVCTRTTPSDTASGSLQEVAEMPGGSTETGNAESGRIIFENRCSFCHFTDKADNKSGPGLKGLSGLERLPVSGKPVSDKNIRSQITAPFSMMPAFTDLSEKDLTDLIAYLKTL